MFVVAGGDAPPVFEAQEAAFDGVALGVGRSVEPGRVAALGALGSAAVLLVVTFRDGMWNPPARAGHFAYWDGSMPGLPARQAGDNPQLMPLLELHRRQLQTGDRAGFRFAACGSTRRRRGDPSQQRRAALAARRVSRPASRTAAYTRSRGPRSTAARPASRRVSAWRSGVNGRWGERAADGRSGRAWGDGAAHTWVECGRQADPVASALIRCGRGARPSLHVGVRRSAVRVRCPGMRRVSWRPAAEGWCRRPAGPRHATLRGDVRPRRRRRARHRRGWRRRRSGQSRSLAAHAAEPRQQRPA